MFFFLLFSPQQSGDYWKSQPPRGSQSSTVQKTMLSAMRIDTRFKLNTESTQFYSEYIWIGPFSSIPV